MNKLILKLNETDLSNYNLVKEETKNFILSEIEDYYYNWQNEKEKTIKQELASFLTIEVKLYEVDKTLQIEYNSLNENDERAMFFITEITSEISESGKKEYITNGKKKGKNWYRFRLKDDDGEIYFYGYCSNNSSFKPINQYGNSYGCTIIEYKNKKTGVYEIL